MIINPFIIGRRLTVVSIEDATPTSVAFDTPYASISQPASVNVTLSDSSVIVVNVPDWPIGDYVQDAAGEYVQQADIDSDLPAGVDNPLLIRALWTITVQEEVFTVTFTAPTGGQTWEVPTGVTEITSMEFIGAGATGSSVATITRGPGGGGGAYAKKNSVPVTAGELLALYIGTEQLGPLPSGTDLDGLPGHPSYMGPNVPAGSTILFGSGAPAGGTGSDGNYYSNYLTGELYGPKASGSWPGSPVACFVRAAGGTNGTGFAPGTGGAGGTTADSIGDTEFAGGSGIAAPASRSGAGGGGAGLSGAGSNGTSSGGTNSVGGAGGAGNPGTGTGGNGSATVGTDGQTYGGGGAGSRNTATNNTRGGRGAQGWGRIIYSGASVPPPEPGDSYQILIAGQSNQITSNGAPTVTYQGQLDGNIFINSATGFEPVEYGVNANPGGNIANHGPILSLAKTLGALAVGEVDFTLSAQSGTSMHTNWNILNNSIGRTTVAKFLQALNYRRDQGKTMHVSGVSFRQGEADQATSNAMNINTGTNTILVGTAAPSSGTGAAGDLFLDKTNNKVYGPKGASSWNAIYVFDIFPGTTILSGSGTPSGGTGSDGNHYYDETNYLWYTKAAGSWGSGSSVFDVFVEEEYFHHGKAFFQYLIDELDDDGFDTTDMIIVISLVDNTFSSGAFQTQIVSAQNRIAAHFTNGVAVSTAGKANFDGVHFTSAAQIQRGLDEAAEITNIP